MYKQHALRYEFINQTTKFDDAGNDKITINNIKSTASLGSVIGMTGTTANVSLYGLSLERIAELSGKANGNFLRSEQKIDMAIYADDALVFYGVMTASIANMNLAPEAGLMIAASANADMQSRAVSPFSARGAQDLTDVISSVCSAAGYTAEFSGIKGMKTSGSPHFEGSVLDQLHQICIAYGLAMQVSPPAKVAFWKSDSKRDDVTPYISKEYGLIGYPVFSNGGVMFQTQYSSLLQIGRVIELKTEVPWASGKYKLTSVSHELSSWLSSGSWHSVCVANREQKERTEDQKNGR
ncbi:hypothetical protein SAMN05216516_10522 [Izhakiella capsodis]|uniref:Uncharacterized protein n=1 Tax=Izhakiella capsodis TaxID=1367852 RepID=A0A1I4XWR3_9GAMM|nr:hypothetical protein [Izhakiella capsodis]SFN29700.1 hypothetical protein SAMN05216516_10522 [Izhakiella capsodis]